MLAYVEFNDKSYGYYECEDIYIDSENIEDSEVYIGGGSLPFRSIKRVTLCKDDGVPSRIVFERRNGYENNINR